MIQINYNKKSSMSPVGEVELPVSKSITTRLLILDFIKRIKEGRETEEQSGAVGEEIEMGEQSGAGESSGEKEVEKEVEKERGAWYGELKDVCEDTAHLAHALEEVSEKPFGNRFDLGSGAAPLRFFVALVASLEGFEGEVAASPQLQRRPLSPLVDALRSVGAEIEYLGTPSYPPLYIKGGKLRGGEIEVDGAVSSQFISAIMMASQLWESPTEISVKGSLISTPYIHLTQRLIAEGGCREPEADWSAAAFFYEVALLCPGKEIRIKGLTPPERSLQGDSGVAALFNLLGVETRWLENGDALIAGIPVIIDKMKKLPEPLELDMGSMPDIVPALAVGMSLSGIKFRFTNISHLRHKESNRIEALRTELEKIGISADATEDTLEWRGTRLPVAENEVIECYEDHRIAMAFAPAAAKFGYVTLGDSRCVEKSFPDYFGQLEKVGFEVGMHFSRSFEKAQ